ncbi:MAG: hypothetical protein AB1714_09300 [Acidobacteriota bacterium]
MKSHRFPSTAALTAAAIVVVILLMGGLALSAAEPADSEQLQAGAGPAFIHVASPANISGNYTDIDNPASNNRPDAVMQVTANWAPHSVYNNHPIGVWYHNNRWSIFNQDLAAMPDQAAFNVQVLKRSRAAFIHSASKANSVGNWTDVSSPKTNGKPNALVLVTPNWAPRHVYDNHSIGVWYHSKWSIFHQDGAPIPRKAAYNVQVLKTGPSAFIHVADPSNSAGNWTDIDSAATNARPDAIVIVTQNWAPHGVYNDHPIGLWYHSGKWSIFNQDLTPIPNQAAFNVHVLYP